ncbi:DUF4111 domain-containing protein [Streptomyces vinaceus]|uniref:hypothetical protein n=1 Tax=Streptomyces vinaceus TaxID=1960 RepID=UPI0036AE6A77
MLTPARIRATPVTGRSGRRTPPPTGLTRLPERHRPVLEHARALNRTCHHRDGDGPTYRGPGSACMSPRADRATGAGPGPASEGATAFAHWAARADMG